MVQHGLEHFWGMAHPVLDLPGDSQRLPGPVGLGRIAGEALVGQVGVILERTGGFDDVDPSRSLTLGQLRSPDSRIQPQITQLAQIG